MKYVNDYNKFNEGLLSNLFGKMFKGLLDSFNDKELTKQANDSIAAIEKTKTIKEFPNIITKMSKIQMDKIDKLEDIKAVNEFLKKDMSVINMLLKTASKKYGMDKLSPNVLYKDSTNNLMKDVFMTKKTFKTEKDFQAAFNENLPVQSEKLLNQIGKKAGYTEEELQKATTTQGQEVKESKLYEGAPQAPAKTDAPVQAQKNPEEDAKFKKLLEQTKLLHKSLYDPLFKKIQEMVKTVGTGTFDEFVKTVKVTKNTDSVKKMINKFAQIDKAKLVKVRDAQGLTKDDAPL